MRTSINKKLWLFLSIILILGIGSGIGYVFLLNKTNQSLLINSTTNFITTLSSLKINYFLNHILVFPFLIISSFFLIGVPLALFYLFYNGFLMGFLLANFILCYHFKGFIFGLFYLLITKLLFIFLLFIILPSLLKIASYILKLLIGKRKLNKDYILLYLKKGIICFLFIFLNDLFLYFLGDNLVNIFKFIIN